MDNHAHNIKKQILVLLIAAALALLLTIMELVAHKNGLELRTFTQVIKGFYLWLVMPCAILFSLNSMIKSLQEKEIQEIQDAKQQKIIKIMNGLRNVVVVIFLFGIFFVSFLRGLYYVLTDEMVTEEMMSDGYIRGTFSSFLSETQHDYYIPTAIFFRKPFPGWTVEELIGKVREKCSPDAEFIEKQSDGFYVFRVPDSLAEGEYIYFLVSNSYYIENNYFSQVLVSEASHFFANRDRYVALTSDGVGLEDGLDTKYAQETADPFHANTLYVTCYDSTDDIAACAADITDWLQFVKETGQFPYDTHSLASYLLTKINVGNSGNYIALDLNPIGDYVNNDSWETRYQRVKDTLVKAFEKHNEWMMRQENDRQSQTGEPPYTEDADTLFMKSYDTDYYEKECLVGDGSIRYRMVVRDAALGSRLYSLLISTDSGKTWQMASSDPFDTQLGMGIDFTFLNEEFGFATLMHNGGDEADLYVTEDGGKTYQLAVLESYTVTLENGFTYSPYDYPQMPYEKDGMIYVLCGQGADGDYNGGDAAGFALYQSTDNGHTFTFVEISPP